ncbi:MAG: MYG1 family protein [Bacilli bacterium]|nr:MYG1 family protein [Bacilli bacterium]
MFTIVKNKNEANAITHAGTFHADDVFASVFLSKLYDVKLYRASEIDPQDKLDNKIIFDIGHGEFDHHDQTAKVRTNGIKYSSFGLLFEKFGPDYLKKKKVDDAEYCYNAFLKELVIQIDAVDNGDFPPNHKEYTTRTLDNVISIFNKTWKEDTDNDEMFLKAFLIAEQIFDRIEKRIIDSIAAKKKVEQAISESQNHILYLKEYMPFMDFLLTSQDPKAKEIYLAIFPSNRGGFNIRTINKEIGNHENRLDFPREWGGKTSEELIALTNIQSFRFCHNGLFLCSCDTLEDAYLIASLAITKK